MKIDLSGKIALVTGGSGELGRVMVRTLGRCGADVALSYLSNSSKAEELCTELESLGVRSMSVQADVTEMGDVLRMRDAVSEKLGDPDIIVNNAVISYRPWAPILEQSLEDYESQFRSCVLHNVLMSKVFVPAMIEKRYGRVIGINTECAALNVAGSSAYVAGKRGMDGVLRVLAKEVGEFGITVNQVAPGWTISDRDREAGTERNAEYEKLVPMGRRGVDQEVANVVAFLASDLASYVSGVYLPVCGGAVMPGI